MVQRIVDNGPTNEEELDPLKALLLNVNSKDDMIAWFENHYYGYFSFNIQQVTVND